MVRSRPKSEGMGKIPFGIESAHVLGASFALLTIGALIAIGRERLRGRAGMVGKIPLAGETLP